MPFIYIKTNERKKKKSDIEKNIEDDNETFDVVDDFGLYKKLINNNKVAVVGNIKGGNIKVILDNIPEDKIKVCGKCGMKIVFLQTNKKAINGRYIFIPYHLNTRGGKCPRKGKRYWRY